MPWEKTKVIIGMIVLGLMATGLTFVSADCSAGQTKHIESLVIGHRFVPGWLETTTHVDADGNSTTDTTWHPEEYHLQCIPCDIEDQHLLDVLVRQLQFESVTNGQYVTIRVFEGRWTGARYLPQLSD